MHKQNPATEHHFECPFRHLLQRCFRTAAGLWVRSGTMATILCIALLCNAQLLADSALRLPAYVGPVLDRTHTLSAEQKAHLETQLTVHENETGNQVVVALVESLQGASIEDYSLQLANSWQLGQRGLDNGVLVLIAPTQRVARIEVGSGLENTLSDARAKQIMENRIVPSFREGDYGRGVQNGVNAILEAVGGHYHDASRNPVSYDPPASISGGRGLKDYFPLLFIAFIALGHLLGGRKPGHGRTASAAFPAGFFGIAATAITDHLFIGILVSMLVFLFLLWIRQRKIGDDKFDTEGYDHYPDAHHPANRYPDHHYRDSRYHHTHDVSDHRDEHSEDRNRYSGSRQSSSSSRSSGGGFSGGGGSFGGGGSSGSW